MAWFCDLKTMTKFILGFSVSCAIMAIVGYLGLARMQYISELSNVLYSQHMMGLSALKEANTDLIRVGRETRQAILDTNREAIDGEARKIEKYAANFVESLDHYAATTTVGDDKAEAQTAKEGFSIYVAACNEAIKVLQQKQDKEAARLLLTGKVGGTARRRPIRLYETR